MGKKRNSDRKDIYILRIRERFRLLLTLKDKPNHIAASFSVGVFIGMSPLLGVHTVLGLIVASLFKLNRLVTIIGVYITNPWTIVPIYTFGTWIGMKLLGVRGIITKIEWTSLSCSNFLEELRELFVPFIAGTFFLGIVSSVIAYIFTYWLLKRAKSE